MSRKATSSKSLRSIQHAVALVACALSFGTVGCISETADVEQQEDNFTNFPSDFPEDGEWAKGRIAKGCDVELGDDVEGFIIDTDGFDHGGYRYPAGVIYEAELDGEVIASAWASNTRLWTEVHCLGD